MANLYPEYKLKNGYTVRAFPTYPSSQSGGITEYPIINNLDDATVLYATNYQGSVHWEFKNGLKIDFDRDTTYPAFIFITITRPDGTVYSRDRVSANANEYYFLWVYAVDDVSKRAFLYTRQANNGYNHQLISIIPSVPTEQVANDGYYAGHALPSFGTYFSSTSSTYGDIELYDLLESAKPVVFPGETSTETDPNNPTGGYIAGDYDDSSDPINLPLAPQGSINLSMYHIYAPSFDQMNSFARWLWNDNGFDLTQLKKIFQNPIDTILSLAQYPFRTSVLAETTEHIVIGAIDSEQDAYEVVSQYVDIDCGNLKINPFYGNALDYAPFTKLTMVLPFVGAVNLDTDEVMGKELNVTYRVDLLTGTFACYVSVGDYDSMSTQKSVFYQFTGNMASQIPITQGSYIEFAKTLMSVAGGLYTGVGGMVGGSIAGGIIGMAEAGANAISGSKSTVTHTGSLSCNAGFLGCRKPYIIKHIPRQSLPKEYGSIAGFPSNLYDKLSNFKGMTRVSEIHLENINCTKSERTEIDGLLKAGVIINEPTNRTEVDGLTLFKNGSENQTIYKSLTQITTTTGELRSGEDVENITIDVLTETENFDYLYLSETNRYYFVTKREVLRGGLVRLYCECDVLESHASEILNQYAIVSRNEKRFNLLINDTYFQTYQNPIIVTKEFPSGLTGEGYVLITAGGTIAV